MSAAPTFDKPTYIPFYEGLFDAIECLEDAEVVEFLRIVRAYAFDGVEPEGKGAARAVFCAIRPSLDKSIERLRTKRRAGKAGGSKKRSKEVVPDLDKAETDLLKQTEADAKQTEANESRREANGVLLVQEKEKDNDKEKDNSPKTKGRGGSRGANAPQAPSRSRRFVEPTVNEVAAYGFEYCKQKGYPPGSFSAEDFWDHWQSKGWHRGRTPMKDWKATVREWIRKDNPRGGKNGGYFSETTRRFDENAILVGPEGF